jgi:hypothetical protein
MEKLEHTHWMNKEFYLGFTRNGGGKVLYLCRAEAYRLSPPSFPFHPLSQSSISKSSVIS